jgi:hypothetical protein
MVASAVEAKWRLGDNSGSKELDACTAFQIARQA